MTRTRSRRRFWLVFAAFFGAALVAAALLIGSMAVAQSEHDVRVAAGAYEDASVTVRRTALRPSLRHVLIIQYEIEGHAELDAAIWHTRPWGEMTLEK